MGFEPHWRACQRAPATQGSGCWPGAVGASPLQSPTPCRHVAQAWSRRPLRAHRRLQHNARRPVSDGRRVAGGRVGGFESVPAGLLEDEELLSIGDRFL